MIIEALVAVVAGLVEALAGLFGGLTMPDWWADLDGWVETLTGHAAGFGSWIPWNVAIGAATFVVTCLGIAFVIRVVRIVASFFTAGGGSAA